MLNFRKRVWSRVKDHYLLDDVAGFTMRLYVVSTELKAVIELCDDDKFVHCSFYENGMVNKFYKNFKEKYDTKDTTASGVCFKMGFTIPALDWDRDLVIAEIRIRSTEYYFSDVDHDDLGKTRTADEENRLWHVVKDLEGTLLGRNISKTKKYQRKRHKAYRKRLEKEWKQI